MSEKRITTGSLVISGIKIAQDNEGRFRLNDLHKASGGEKRHQPSDWLRIQQTKELIQEIINSGKSRSLMPVKSTEGRKGGTFVTKELVYAYAMWVSPAFHLHVIDTFDALVTGQIEMAQAKAARERARMEAPALTDAVKYLRQSQGKDLKPYHFSNEFNLINRLVLGCTSKGYRNEHGLKPNDPIRDTLTPCEIQAVEHMQRLNASLIDVGMPYEQRKAKLHQVFLLRHQRALISESLRLEA